MGVNGFIGIKQQKYHVNNHLNSSAKTEGPVTSDNRKWWTTYLKSAVQINERPALHIATDKKKNCTGTVAQRVKQHQAARHSDAKRQRQVVTSSRTTETLSVLEAHFLSAATSAMLALGRDPKTLLDLPRQILQTENRALTEQDLQGAKTIKPLLIDGLTREFINLGFPKKRSKSTSQTSLCGGFA